MNEQFFGRFATNVSNLPGSGRALTLLIDVARSIGYDSDAAFSKAFKRVVGVNTGEYLRASF